MRVEPRNPPGERRESRQESRAASRFRTFLIVPQPQLGESGEPKQTLHYCGAPTSVTPAAGVSRGCFAAK